MAWPRQDYLELTAVTDAIPSARYHVRLVMLEWGFGNLAYDVEQVTAELVANAVAATQAISWTPAQPPVRLWLLAADHQAMVVIWDATTSIPVPRLPGPGAESGRGLLLVGALADWGYYLPPAGWSGKVVHALLPKAGPPAAGWRASPPG
jgi:hypothetical protein